MPTFMLELKFNDKGAVEGVRQLNNLGNAAQNAEQDAKRLSHELSDIAKRMDGMAASARRLVKGLGLGLGVHELNQLRKALTQAASDAEETANKFNVVFASVKDAAAESLALDYGMSRTGAQAVLAQTGDLLTGLGLTADEALKLSERTAQLGTDLASFSNYAGGAEGVINALTKALLGETEAAKMLGVVLGENQMVEYAKSVGKVWTQLNLAEKAQLRLDAAVKQSPNAVGNFARSMGSYANQARVADAALKDFIVSVGQGLLPATTQALKAINDNRAAIQELGESLGSELGDALKYVTENFVDIVETLKVAGAAYLTFRATQKLATLGFFSFIEGLGQGAMEAIRAQKELEGTEKALKKTAVAAQVAKKEVSLLGSGMKGLVGLLGGPWVIRITAATTALTYFATAESGAEKYAKMHADAMRLVSRDTDEAARAVADYTEKLSKMNREQLEFAAASARDAFEKFKRDYTNWLGNETLTEEILKSFDKGMLGEALEEELWVILAPLRKWKTMSLQEIEEVEKALKDFSIKTETMQIFSDIRDGDGVLGSLLAAKTQLEQTGGTLENYAGQNEKVAQAATQTADATNGLTDALNRLPRVIEFATPEQALEWLEKYTASINLAKEESKKAAEASADNAIAKLAEAAAIKEAAGNAEEAANIYKIIGDMQKRIASGFKAPTITPKDDPKRKAEETAKALADLEVQINRLNMTEREFREWELVNHTLPELMEKTGGATEKVKAFEEATRKAWAAQDIQQAQEKAKQNLQVQVDFYKQLGDKAGQYGLGLEYVNWVIEEQVEAWRNADIPDDYIDKMEYLLRLEASTDGWAGVQRAMRTYYADSTNMGRQFESFMTNSIASIEDAFVDFTMKGKFSFSDLANSIINDLVRIAYKAMVVAPIVNAITGLFSGPTTLASSGGAKLTSASLSTRALQGGVYGGMNVGYHAKGAVFSGGNISDFSGQIVDRPTAFSYGRHLSAFAAGGGIMGEAGPEAILPLERGKNGQLGLAMSGMDDIMERAQRGFASETAKYMQFVAEQRAQVIQPKINIQVVNNTGQQVQARTQSSPDGQGGMNLEIILEQIEGGLIQRDKAGKNKFSQYLDNSRGMSRAGRLYR